MSSGSTNVPNDDHQKTFYKSSLLKPTDGVSIESIDIEFLESFHDFDRLQSISCWFTPAYTNSNASEPSQLFDFSTEETFGGLGNINTSKLVNVDGLFGGIEAFNVARLPLTEKINKLICWHNKINQ